jgi:hypothetical protein
MTRRWLLIWLLSFLAAPLMAETERMFFIAPKPLGDDRNAGTREAPFATLERARVAVREYRATHEPRGEIVVELQRGHYEVAAPVRFDASDSGREGMPVVYSAAADSEVVLSGGKRVTEWRREADRGFSADVGRDVDFRQLWVGGRRGVRARSPNVGQYFTMTAEKQADGFDLPRDQFAGVTMRPSEVEISVLIAWMHKRLRISNVAAGSSEGVARAVIESPEWDAVTKQPQGDRVYTGRHYWLENAPEFLDAPGEFYLDRATGVVRYRARPGEELADVVRPELESLIVLDGRLDAPVHDLRFEGLTFAHTGWTRPNRAGFVDVQANSLVPADTAAAVDTQYRHDQRKDRVPAAFQAFTADRIVIRGCRFAHLGGTGVMFTHGGDDNVVEGNSFYDLAAGGIEFGEDAATPKNPRLFPRRNRISNNFLAHIGEDYFGSVAILGYYTERLEISHNEIATIPYTGVSQGWGWGKPPAPAESRDNRITHNHVSNYMRGLDDGGGIYTTDRLFGSEIAYNVIERMWPPDAQTKAGGALYLDQFTEGVRVHHNVVTDAIRWLFIWNPNIRCNRVENNYADTAAQRNDGTDNVVEAVNLFAGGSRSREVAAIVDGAGIEARFAKAREFSADREIIVENAAADCRAVGAWETVTLRGSYAGTVKRSVAEGATMTVLPLLPKVGSYEVCAWQPAASGPASYLVRHDGGETQVVVGGGSSGEHDEQHGRWVRIGTFKFKAGLGGEIRISAAGTRAGPAARVVVDAIRFRRQSD